MVDAIGFEELVAYGLEHCGPHSNGRMPWSFKYKGHPITHENDECYLIPAWDGAGSKNFHVGQVLITRKDGQLDVISHNEYVRALAKMKPSAREPFLAIDAPELPQTEPKAMYGEVTVSTKSKPKDN